jgi:hypothetical protein
MKILITFENVIKTQNVNFWIIVYPNNWTDSYIFFKTSKVDKWMMCKYVINIFINDVHNVMSTN